MSDGIFADLGLDEVDADPMSFPDGTYKGVVFDAKIQAYKDAAKGKALILTYKIAEGEHKGKTIDEWKSANSFDDAAKKGWLKQRLLSLGVPESRLGSVQISDLVGTEVFFTKKKKGEYNNVTFVRLADETSSGPAAQSSDLSDLL